MDGEARAGGVGGRGAVDGRGDGSSGGFEGVRGGRGRARAWGWVRDDVDGDVRVWLYPRDGSVAARDALGAGCGDGFT